MLSENEKQELEDQWKQFIKNLQSVGKRKLKQRNNTKYRPLESLLDDVVNRILGDDAINAFKESVDNVDDDVVQFFKRELEFYNDLVVVTEDSDCILKY